MLWEGDTFPTRAICSECGQEWRMETKFDALGKALYKWVPVFEDGY